MGSKLDQGQAAAAVYLEKIAPPFTCQEHRFMGASYICTKRTDSSAFVLPDVESWRKQTKVTSEPLGLAMR